MEIKKVSYPQIQKETPGNTGNYKGRRLGKFDTKGNYGIQDGQRGNNYHLQADGICVGYKDKK